MNNDKYLLGKKIRSFRKLKGITQLELENLIDGSSGMVSRLENGETNPTKETLRKIKTALNLTTIEYSYLAGELAYPPSEEIVQKAIDTVADYFNSTNRLAYLVDDRMRICSGSKGFLKYMGLSEEFVNKNLKGRFVLELMLKPELKIRDFIETDQYEDIVFYQLVRFKKEVGFMIDDPVYQQALAIINSNPLTKKLWPTITTNQIENILSSQSRTVHFKMGGVKVSMVYSVEPVSNFNDRFDVVEYVPTNRVLRFLSKL